jgi:hypothetical protein
VKGLLGFDEPLEDGEEPYTPNRAERRAQQQQHRREAKAANKAWQKKVAERRARRPLIQALQNMANEGDTE